LASRIYAEREACQRCAYCGGEARGERARYSGVAPPEGGCIFGEQIGAEAGEEAEEEAVKEED